MKLGDPAVYDLGKSRVRRVGCCGRRVGPISVEQHTVIGVQKGLVPVGLQFQVFEPGDGGLKARVVIQRHLVVDVLLPQILVVVVLVGSADQRAVQHLRIGFSAPICFPVARSRTVHTRAANRQYYNL